MPETTRLLRPDLPEHGAYVLQRGGRPDVPAPAA